MTDYLVGRGIGDVTGEPSGRGMLGYGKADQITSGIHTRLRSRAFIVVDAGTGERVLLVVSELPLMFDSVHRAVLRRLRALYGGLYTDRNSMLTVTHTHCGPGGYSEHLLYNTTTGGFQVKTFEAIVSGIVHAVSRAHEDLAPATLRLSHGELFDASVNRSPTAFDRNPKPERDCFPDRIDPLTTLLRMERGGALIGAVNWFATHGTSMTNTNTLISSDNKGFAAYQVERLDAGVDYRADTNPALIVAFAQTNSGDMSPNLNRRPGSGPTEDEFENTRIIGGRQARAASALAGEPGVSLQGGVAALTTYVNLADIHVRPEFTGDGREHRTSAPAVGAAALAGTDEGPGFKGFRQGRNRFWDTLARQVIYRLSPRLRETQAPKGLLFSGGLAGRLLPIVQQRYPIQLMRIGCLYLIGLPGEATIVAGLRLRRTVAAVLGVDLHCVLVAGYSNGYFHYVTTPEEYEEQRYEGGSTLFGKWQLPALQQVVAELAGAMLRGRDAVSGPPPPDLSARRGREHSATVDEPLSGFQFGDVVDGPATHYGVGEQVSVAFAGANPNNDLHTRSTYLEINRESGTQWSTIADDGDWSTKIRWNRAGKHAFRVTITWDIPPATPAGRYRIAYHGEALAGDGTLRSFSGCSEPFHVN
ncbi:neutral/alkaline non-lysosomal ceramidase N-terminal domain-containing protein [Mycobacteroides franklinii]|uniref:neutral/alkaline non-lysosomal ceramidase N-terminal domain-containing protein n=1 Tax=Mycobacteroides franklinii TaxID=948102 RepID=UPI000B075CCF|nr:neutral/alkaline non-lysosomal ceramidase N-terminal domain-containing protein [Mycobacteroides franklinii]